MGIGHPFIDALIAFLQGPRTSGEVTLLKTNGTSTEPRLLTRALITVEGEARQTHNEVKIIQFNKDGQAALVPEDWDLRCLDTHNKARSILDLRLESLPWEAWHRAYESTVGALLTQARIEVDNPLAARVKLLGISVVV
jgi:hypothetical protein